MRLPGVAALGLACFVCGLMVQGTSGKSPKVTFNPDVYRDKDAKVAAISLLETALKLAGDGSWERIAVGRAWYLGGDKAKGQQLFDEVTGGKEVGAGDWFRIARAYCEAGDWDKAQRAYDKALAINVDDDSGMIEYGGFANVNHDRAKAEELFGKALAKNPDKFWHYVNAGGSYLGVRPR